MTFEHSSVEQLLCLKCRGAGHIAAECPDAPSWTLNGRQFLWFFSAERKLVKDLLLKAGSVCSRCQKLELTSLLREQVPWKSPQDIIEAQRDGHPLIRNIGKAGSIEFRDTCAVCVCLFAMTPSPASPMDDILLYPDWTLNRLAGENGREKDNAEQRKYAKCLLIALQPNATNTSFYVRGHRGDALCILEDDLLPNETLGGREVELELFNIDQVASWLESCRTLHGSDCEPEYTEELQGIRLVDIESRKVVAYPGSPCDYAALSYVWGGVEQGSFRIGSDLVSVPQTIEDAMACVKLLGKRYLWVDSICIDQADYVDKMDQIARMWSIYRGSSLTLITLSSSSANSGLSRFCPDLTAQPQLRCTIDGVRLVGLMPTLSQYIWTESWGSRAWTLQEALLSHRCLYLSDHQLYFECETMQYCESLNETRSWAHSLTAGTSPNRQNWLTWVMEQNGSGCLRNLLDTPADRFLHGGQKVTLYSYRSMTKQEDGLRAFDGVLQRLGTMYKAGFFWGLPLEDFQWGLLWQAQWPATKRPGFPTWCWAGSEAGMMTPFPVDIRHPHRSPVSLRIWKAEQQKLILIFDAEERAARAPVWENDDTDTGGRDAVEQAGHPQPNDTGTDVAASSNEASPATAEVDYASVFGLSRFSDADNYALFLEVYVIQLEPDFSKPTHERALGGLRGHFVTQIAGVRCTLYIMTTDTFISGLSQLSEGVPKYLIVALNSHERYEQLHILVVVDYGTHCVRWTSLSMLVPREEFHEVLKALQIRQEYIVLA